MGTKSRLATILIALTIFGCKGTVQTSAASAGDGGSGSSSGDGASSSSGFGSGFGGGTQVAHIPDPSMNNMNAFAITIPAGWKFDGILMQSGACTSGPFVVYRANSSDGQSKIERLPVLGWTWGTGPAAPRKENSCLPLSGPMSAQDYLKYLAATMHLEYVGEERVPEEDLAALQRQGEKAAGYYGGNANSGPHMELARATVRSKNGSTTIMGQLRGTLTCSQMNTPGMRSGVRGVPDRAPSSSNICAAGVTYFSAPENHFENLMHAWDSEKMGGRVEPAWSDAWVQRNKEQTARIVAGMAAQSEASLAAQRQQFAHSQAVQQQMHEDFMNTLQRGTDLSMQRTADSMNARSTSTSDWVDYSLDRQTVMDPNTGRIGKISNQDTIGGSLQKVHGDGTPY
jgi:hypothetical protein